MRKKLEERHRQRVAPVITRPPPANAVEPQEKWAEPRKQWCEPPKEPVIAQQCDATGVVIEGWCNH